MSLIAILGQFDIHPDDTPAAAELMRVMMSETVKEQGCRHYAYARDLSNPNRFQLSELWDAAASLEAHFHAPHTLAYRAGMSKLKVQSRTVSRYDVTNVANL